MGGLKGKSLKNSKAVAKKGPQAIAAPGQVRRGFEEGTAKEDLIIPRAKLLQALSPEVVDGVKSPDGKDLKIGMIINSLTKDVLPTEFIPVFKFTNWIRFNPRNDKDMNFNPAFEPGAIIWRSNDPADPKVQAEGAFGPNGEPPLATKFINFFAYFPGMAMPIIVGFSKTSYKAGRQLLSLAKFTSGDMFSKKYKLGSKVVKGEFTYNVFTVDPSGVPAEAEFKFAEVLWNEYASKVEDIQVHDEAGAAEEEATAPGKKGEKAPF